MHSILDANNRFDHTKALAFLDPHGGVTLQRYEKMKYPQFDRLTDKQIGFFWRPEEIDTVRDAKDFRDLTAHEQHIFTANLKRQILLDSVQGRSPCIAFLPIVSLPEIEAWITAWSFFEMIHSRSYTHIIRNVYNDPSVVFDEMMDIDQIVDCAHDISEHYDHLIELSMQHALLGEGKHIIDGKPIEVSLYELKKALWMTIMSVNILEGVRFYVSFACSWAFGEVKRMEGNAKIIKMISRDENVHLASTQMLLKLLLQDDSTYVQIADETREATMQLFADAVKQEKTWAKYLFRDGSMIGLNYDLLAEYVEYIANKRLTAIGLPLMFKTGANPLPWTQKWIAGQEVQVAPQEVAVSSYIVGGTTQDVTADTFRDFNL